MDWSIPQQINARPLRFTGNARLNSQPTNKFISLDTPDDVLTNAVPIATPIDFTFGAPRSGVKAISINGIVSLPTNAALRIEIIAGGVPVEGVELVVDETFAVVFSTTLATATAVRVTPLPPDLTDFNMTLRVANAIIQTITV